MGCGYSVDRPRGTTEKPGQQTKSQQNGTTTAISEIPQVLRDSSDAVSKQKLDRKSFSDSHIQKAPKRREFVRKSLQMNIFAHPFGSAELKLFNNLEPPNKTEEEKAFLVQSLTENYLFEACPKEELEELAQFFEKVNVQATADGSDPIIVLQGEVCSEHNAFFYIVYRGRCNYLVDGKVVGSANPGQSFGELALLYNCPRAATVCAIVNQPEEKEPEPSLRLDDLVKQSSCTEKTTLESFTSHNDEYGKVVLFRVHQRDFRCCLQKASESAYGSKVKLLNEVPFLYSATSEQKETLAKAMRPRPFHEGERLVTKGQEKMDWMIIERGEALARNISAGGSSSFNDGDSDRAYKDFFLTEGDSFGQRNINSETPCVADVISQTVGLAYVVDRDIFKATLGDLQEAMAASYDGYKLKAIPIMAK